MKKILLLLLIIVTGASQLKAQQHSIDSMLFKAPKNFNQFKLSDSSLFKNFNPSKQNPFAVLSGSNKVNAEPFYSRMPEVKLQGNDNMAIIKPQSNEHYTMLIKRIKVADPLVVVKPTNP